MKSKRVEIIGGGPGGLLLARLLKLRQPDWPVIVHERQTPTHTFGFGVSFTARTLNKFLQADPAVQKAILTTGKSISRMELHTRNDCLISESSSGEIGIGIGRTFLLQTLADLAREAGVEIKTGQRAHYSELKEADVIVAADGVGSATRHDLAEALGAKVRIGKGLYLWSGAEVALAGTHFDIAETSDGLFVTHAYPFSNRLSTFAFETDEATWKRAGLDKAAANTSPNETDDISLRYLSNAFHKLLGGQSLIGNRSQWLRFRTVECRRWHHGNIVLLGDAAHTAHYSIGSGTKIAMEDAIALAEALVGNSEVGTAFEQYEAERRPAVERLQGLASHSQDWWESYGSRIKLPASQVFISYLTRAGNVPLFKFAQAAPQVVETAVSAYKGAAATAENGPQLLAEITGQPLTRGPICLPGRLVGLPLKNLELAVLLDKSPEGQSYRLGRVKNGEISYVETTETAEIPFLTQEFTSALVFGIVKAGSEPAWSQEGDELLGQGQKLCETGCQGIKLVVGAVEDSREALLSRLDLAERLRLTLGCLVNVEGSALYFEDLVAGLLSARTDLITLQPETTLI